MKTLEMSYYMVLVASLFIAGIGSLLPSFFNLAGYMSALVYVIVAICLGKAYKNKLWFKFNNRE